VEDFADLWTLVPKKSYHHLGNSQLRSNNFGCAETTEPPWQKPLVVSGIVVGPFEEEEEGTGIASEVVNVEGEDLATPGCLRSVDTTKPPDRNDSPILVNQTKQQTLQKESLSTRTL